MAENRNWHVWTERNSIPSNHRLLFFKVAKMTNKMTSREIIERPTSIFARHGILETLISGSAKFLKCSDDYGFTHMASSLRYAQSNGEAELALQAIKNLLKKATDLNMAILCCRTTPLHNGSTSSPAQLLMGRQLCTNLPVIAKQLHQLGLILMTWKRRKTPTNIAWRIISRATKTQ